MARQLLLKTLVSVLGDFVDGLTEDNLKVGVWSGVIMLENLSLNREGIKKLHLPIEVKHGYIGSLRVSIPWSRLTSESVNIEIQDVFLLANPVDPKSWDPDELRKVNLETKRALLEKLGQAIGSSGGKGDGKDGGNEGYFARLGAKIADNIFIFIKSVHVRYEDPVSDPHGLLSMGIMIQDFQIQTTDGQWQPAFLSREEESKKGTQGAIYKKADLRGFAVYWSPRIRKGMGKEKLDTFLGTMRQYAIDPAAEGLESLTYLIQPNDLSLKIIHNEHGNTSAPKFFADVELPSMSLYVQAEQFQQILMVKDTFDLSNRLQLLLPHRPKHRPTRGHTREWWKYAFFCVTKPKKSSGIIEVLAFMRQRKTYLRVYEKVLLKESLSEDEQAELDAVEEDVNLTTLLIWRRIVRAIVRQKKRLLRTQKKQQREEASRAAGTTKATSRGVASPATAVPTRSDSQKDKAAASGGGGGWFSWLKGKGGAGEADKKGSRNEDDDDTSESEAEEERVSDGAEEDGIFVPPDGVPEGDISIDELLAQADMATKTPRSTTQDLFQVQVSTRGVIKLMGLRRAPIMELRASFKMQAAQKGETMTVGLQLPEFEVLDQYTPTALFDKIAEVAHSRITTASGSSTAASKEASSTNVFDLSLRTSPGDTSVTIRTRPLNIVYNRHWVAELIKLFRPPPEISEALMKQAVANMSAATAVAGQALQQVSGLHTDLEIAAPRILIPVHESMDSGYLVLDPGTLSLKGGTLPSDPSSSAWDLRLSDIGSSLPSCRSESFESSGQLIDPFTVSVSLRLNGPATLKASNGAAAATSVRADLQPRVRGLLTPCKLQTLLRILTNLGLPEESLVVGDDPIKPLTLASAQIGQSVMQLQYGDAEASSDKAGASKPAVPKPPAKLDATQGQEEGKAPEDPATKNMELSLEIPQVVLELEADRSADPRLEYSSQGGAQGGVTKLFIVSMDRLSLDMVSRPYDSDMHVGLAGIAIQNLLRPGESGYMAQSFAALDEDGVEGAQAGNLVTFRMLSILDRKASPLHKGFDRELDLVFTRLELKLDPDSVRALKPFYHAVVDTEEAPAHEPAVVPIKRSLSNVSATSSVSTVAAAASSLLSAVTEAAASQTMRVHAHMQSVSLELLRSVHATAGGASVSVAPVIMAEIVGLQADVRMLDAMRFDLVLHSFEVVDTQPASADNAIRKLICPREREDDDEDAAEGEEEAKRKADQDSDDAKVLASAEPDASRALGVVSRGGRRRKALLSVELVEDKKAHMYNIDVKLVDFTMHVLVEAILASIDVTLETVNAVMDMLGQAETPVPLPSLRMAAITEEASDDDEDGGAAQIAHAQSSMMQPQGDKPLGLCVQVTLANPQLVLVENARNYDSRALTMRGSYSVVYVREQNGPEMDEQIMVKAQGLEAYVDVVGEASDPAQIVEPFSLGARLKRKSEMDKLLVMDLWLQLPLIEARVAFHDVMLVKFILNGLSEAATRFGAQTDEAAMASAIVTPATFNQSRDGTSALRPSWDGEGGGDEVENVPPTMEAAIAEKEMQRTNVTHTIINVSLEGLQVTCINDVEEREQPVLSFHIQNAGLSLDSTGPCFKANLQAALQARFFNPSVLYWEPLIEPWGFELESGSTMDGMVTSLSNSTKTPVLNVNITGDFLKTLSRTYSLLMNTESGPGSRADKGAGGKYLVTNRCGLEVEVDGGAGPLKLKPNHTATLDVRSARRSRAVDRQHAGAGVRREKVAATVDVRVVDGVMGQQRKPLAKLRVDAPGSFVYPLKPVQDTHRTYNQPVVEELFENERCERVTGRWRTPYLPTDRNRWTDEGGRNGPTPEEIHLPSGEWRWQDDWHVDMRYGVVDEQIDKDGWTYGVEFPGFNLNRIKRTHREMDGVRRRRWVRTRVPIPPELDDPCRPMFLVWSVDVQADGRTHLSVDTTVKVVNETSMGFDLESLIDESTPPMAMDGVGGKAEVFVPCRLTYAPFLRIRPQFPGYSWSKPFLADKSSGAVETIVACQAEDMHLSHPMVVVIDVQPPPSGNGPTRVLLRPAFVIENVLPCRAFVRMLADISQPENPHTLCIEPGLTEGVLTLTPTASQWMQVRVLDMDWSQPEEIGASAGQRMSQFKSFHLTASGGPKSGMADEEIYLSGWVVQPDLSKLRFTTTLWTRCWVVDRTGLGLFFCENPTSRRNRGKTRFSRRYSRQLSESTTGQGYGRRRSREEPIGTEAASLVTILPHSLDVASPRQYQVSTVDNGSRIYTDSPCVFTNLPPRLRRKTCICPPNADRLIETNALLKFQVSGDAEVLVLYDVSGGDTARLPGWIQDQGFARVEGLTIPINTHRREEGLIRFQAFSKKVAARGTVVLGGNHRAPDPAAPLSPAHTSTSLTYGRSGSAGAGQQAVTTRNNYVAFVLRDTDALSLAVQPPTEQAAASTFMGGEDESLGVLLFDPPKATMCVAVGDEDSWSKPLDVDNPVERGIFEVEGDMFHYDLSVSIDVCPGIFWRTKQVTVTPRFVVVNCLDMDISLRQSDVEAEDRAVRLSRQSRSPFYWTSNSRGGASAKKEMQIMIHGQTRWSYGGVNLENVGSTAVLLPRDDDPTRQKPIVVNVEVKLAEGTDECAVVVAVWMAKQADPPVYRIDNFTPHHIQFVQSEVRRDLPCWVLPPGQTTAYGWEYPCAKHHLSVRVMTGDPDKRTRTEMKLDRVGDGDVLELGKGKGRVLMLVVAEDGSRVLKIATTESALAPAPRPPGNKETTVKVQLAGLGISLVAADEEEGRRELAYLFVDRVGVEYSKDEDGSLSLEAKLHSLQIDNHGNKAVFPVALCPKTSKTDQTFLHFALSADADPDRPSRTSINYLAFELLAADVQLDLRSLFRFLQFGQHFAFLNYEVAQAELHPDKYIANLKEFYTHAEPLPWVDVSALCETVQSSRLYLRQIELHPLSIALSFVQTVTDGKRVGIYGNLLEVIKNLATISRAPIQLKSFSVEHVMETPSRFISIVLTHYKRQAFGQIFAIAGSLTTFGSPANLVMNVGTGVKDFFYEPINGLVQSPKAFARGLRKGTNSLIKGVVSGTLNSMAGVGDTLNRNVAMLGFDREYAQEREQRRQAQRTDGSGFVEGLKGGGTSLVRGFADGIGGLVTTPMKEARTGGVGGFFKGVGKGVLGLAVKPLVGVGDAVVSVIQGASQAAQDIEQHKPCRPRRALPRLASNGKQVLTDYSLTASRAQEMVEAGDAYVCHLSLPDEDVVLTDRTLVLAPTRSSDRAATKLPWRDISYCQWVQTAPPSTSAAVARQGADDFSVLVHLYTADVPLVLRAGNQANKEVLYEQLSLHSSKMGNGSKMPSLDDILAGRGGDSKGGEDTEGVTLDGYRFGSANDQDLRCRKVRSWEIVKRAKDRLFLEWEPSASYLSWHQLDDAVWKAINDWVKNHRPPLNFRMVIAIVIINQSSSGIQLRDTKFRDGSEVHVIESPTYDSTSRVLAAGGAVLVLAWSHIPSLVKKASVDLSVDMTAFTGHFTDQLATIIPRPGYEAVFLEKTRKPDYCKYVVVVRS